MSDTGRTITGPGKYLHLGQEFRLTRTLSEAGHRDPWTLAYGPAYNTCCAEVITL